MTGLTLRTNTSNRLSNIKRLSNLTDDLSKIDNAFVIRACNYGEFGKSGFPAALVRLGAMPITAGKSRCEQAKQSVFKDAIQA